jgi:hypothetical protein
MAETEQQAGRLASYRVVEVYRAVAATVAPATPSAAGLQRTARAWAEGFCADASRRFVWEQPWRLIVHEGGPDGRRITCVISSRSPRDDAPDCSCGSDRLADEDG